MFTFSVKEISRRRGESYWQSGFDFLGMRTVITPEYYFSIKNSHLSDNRPNGVRFVAPAGTTEFAKRWNPQPGDIVSFKHRGFMFTSNKPKMPTLFRIRDDITWDDVVHRWNEKIITPTGKVVLNIFLHIFLPQSNQFFLLSFTTLTHNTHNTHNTCNTQSHKYLS